MKVNNIKRLEMTKNIICRRMCCVTLRDMERAENMSQKVWCDIVG